jgi:hypothetical protein
MAMSPDGATDPCAAMTDCSQCGTLATCLPCCQGSNTAGAVALTTYIGMFCACASTMVPCNSACAATLCKGMQPDQTCAKCLQGLAMNPMLGCVQMTVQKCGQDAMCAALLQCLTACPTM